MTRRPTERSMTRALARATLAHMRVTRLKRTLGPIAAVFAAVLLPFAVALAADPPPIGPPFPDPVVDQAVYDFAGVFRPETIAGVEATIDAIEARTGAEIAVYTQNVHFKPSTEETDARARALIDQWGVGRKGFDDGLVIFFDLDDSLVHGQVILYAGAGYEAAFLSRSERQSLFEDEMLPLLLREDLDGALLVAMERIDANATPEHANTLQTARQIDAAVGLIGAPVILFVLIGWVATRWWRYGRDPVYLDDPSIYMAGPPPELSAASAAFVIDGKSSRRALTTALLDLASRGDLAFRKVDKFLAQGRTRDRHRSAVAGRAHPCPPPAEQPTAAQPRRTLRRRAPAGDRGGRWHDRTGQDPRIRGEGLEVR